MFCKTKQLIDVGLALQQRDAAENGDLSEDEDTQACREKRLSKISPKIRERYKRSYVRLLHLAPSLKPLLGDPRKASELNVTIKKMDAIISGIRSDDTSRLKRHKSAIMRPSTARTTQYVQPYTTEVVRVPTWVSTTLF